MGALGPADWLQSPLIAAAKWFRSTREGYLDALLKAPVTGHRHLRQVFVVVPSTCFTRPLAHTAPPKGAFRPGPPGGQPLLGAGERRRVSRGCEQVCEQFFVVRLLHQICSAHPRCVLDASVLGIPAVDLSENPGISRPVSPGGDLTGQ